MSTIYLIVLCSALVATLTFAGTWVLDTYRSRRERGRGDSRPRRPWYDGAIDQLLVTFAVVAVALVIGLVASGADVDLLDVGADAMLIAAGITGTERLVARHRAATGGRAAPTAVLLCVAAAVGAVGGLANLGA